MVRLGILFGGNSLEHEISIISAFQLKKKLSNEYEIKMVYLNEDNSLFDVSRYNLKEFKERLNKAKLKKTCFIKGGYKRNKLDCMLLSLHGENGEDGIGAAICRFFSIPFVGSDLFASSCAIDKYLSYLYLSKNGIKMLKSEIYTYADYLQGKKLTYFPCIIKPVNGGSSIGICVCNSEEDVKEKLVEALMVSKELIIQPFLDNIVEYNMAIYDNGNSKLERITKKDKYFTFENKYNESFKLMHQTIDDPYNSEEFIKIGRRVYNLLKCQGIIRIDFFLVDNVIYVNEVNIIPGALAMYLFDDFPKVIKELVNKARLQDNPKYQRGNFLENTNINK